MYVKEELSPYGNYPCPLQPDIPLGMPYNETGIVFEFKNNTANSAGESIYGGYFDTCNPGSYKLPTRPAHVNPSDVTIYDAIFNLNFIPHLGHIPLGVCRSHSQSVGTVPLSSQAIVWSIWSWQLKILQNCLTTCINLPCSPSNSTLVYWVQGVPPICGCEFILADAGLTCDIDMQRVHRPEGIWVGYSITDNITTNVNMSEGIQLQITVHKHCPFDYCIQRDNDIHLDEQCQFNRSAVLCGQCKRGYSLVLGSNRCRKHVSLTTCCVWSSWYMVLVAFLILCDLTVTKGTLSGLILYANKSLILPTLWSK